MGHLVVRETWVRIPIKNICTSFGFEPMTLRAQTIERSLKPRYYESCHDIFEYFRLSKAVSIQQDQSSFNLCFFTQILSNAFTMYIFYQRVAAVSRF